VSLCGGVNWSQERLGFSRVSQSGLTSPAYAGTL
jgi:hypothetical protein